jgi:hypothetical protein
MSALAATYRFSAQQFYRLCEVGIIGSKDRIELLNGELMEIHRSPEGPTYRERITVAPGGTASPLAFLDVVTDVAEIIPPK